MLGELDLEASFARLGALGEDIDDEGGAVDDLHVGRLLDDALLRGGELVVEDDDLGAAVAGRLRDLFQLAASEIGVGALGEALAEDADDLCTGGPGELGELVERVVERQHGALGA